MRFTEGGWGSSVRALHCTQCEYGDDGMTYGTHAQFNGLFIYIE